MNLVTISDWLKDFLLVADLTKFHITLNAGYNSQRSKRLSALPVVNNIMQIRNVSI